MAEITLAEIRDTIRFRGDYQNVRKFPSADVDKEIQRSFGEFYEIVDNAHQGYWDTIGTVTTVASQAYIALPTRTWRVKRIDRLDGSDYIELAQVGVEVLGRYGTRTGKPTAYRLTARGIDLYTTPDAAYTLRVVYTPMAPLLAESQPREWYNGWEEYVIESTLLKLDKRERLPVNDRVQTLDMLAKRITEAAGERRSQEPEYLRLREYDTINVLGEEDPY